MAGGWAFALVCFLFSYLYFDALKAVARNTFGIAAPATEVAARVPRPEPRRHAGSPSGSASGPVVELRAVSNGHYFTAAEINGRAVNVMVDTGASMVALSWDDANRAGLFVRNSDYTQRVQTANGVGRFAPVTIDRISIGPITVRNVPAAVSEPGALSTSLLGMSFLSRLQRVDMRSGTLVLTE